MNKTMKTLKNLSWLMVLFCCLFSISCESLGNFLIDAGTSTVNVGVDIHNAGQQETGAKTGLIGLVLAGIGHLIGGKDRGARGLPQIPIHEVVPATPDQTGVNQATGLAVNTPPSAQSTGSVIDNTGMAETKDSIPVQYPTTSSSVTQTSSQNIGLPQVNELANADSKVLPRSRDPRRGNNPNTPNTNRNSTSTNPNAGNTSSRAQGAGGSSSYTQPNQQQQTSRSSASANPNAGNTGSRAGGAGGSSSYIQPSQQQQTPRNSTSAGTQGTGSSSSSPTTTQVQRSAVVISDSIPPSIGRQSSIVPSLPSSSRPNQPPNVNENQTQNANMPSLENPLKPEYPDNVISVILSGVHWVDQFPTSRSVVDLASPFRENVQDFINALNDAGAIVIINATHRPDNRAQLMHYSWKIAKGEIDSQKVPVIPGININWVHNDVYGNYSSELSMSAAKAMVTAYQIENLKVAPSRTSNHIKGLAIDMNIRWHNLSDNTSIFVRNKFGEPIKVERPSGDSIFNADLNQTIIDIGKTYGVIKFTEPEKDPPHWSVNGR